MRYVDEFLYNLVAELRLWSARHQGLRGAARSVATSRVGPLTSAFVGLLGGSRAVAAGAETDRPLV